MDCARPRVTRSTLADDFIALMTMMIAAVVADLQLAFEQHAALAVGQHAVSNRGPEFVSRLAQLGFELSRVRGFDDLELIALGGHSSILRLA
jgi:hypothetical protein